MAGDVDMSGAIDHRRWSFVLSGLLGLFAIPAAGHGAEPPSFDALAAEYTQAIRPLIGKFCLECHSADTAEGDLDLERFTGLDGIRRATKQWQKVAEMLDSGEMPPKAARRMPAEERRRLRGWVERYLGAEALATAGDPGPVVLRRLNNAQYTYTLRDLTGVDLRPARDFPVDGAAGEGFTNAGGALAMSPALLSKYLDAAKGVAAHAVPLPDGLRFSPGTSPRDWTDEILREIKAFYHQFADAEGRPPLEAYLAATLEEREALNQGTESPETVARRRGLNGRYLATLWSVLSGRESGPSLPLDGVRSRWRQARPGDAAAIAAEVARWQKTLSAFQRVGAMKPWVVAVNPLTTRQELRFKFPESEAEAGSEVTLYLAAGDAGDGPADDVVVWQRPRLVMAGRPDLALRDVRDFTRALAARRGRVFASAANCLAAAAEAGASGGGYDLADLARRHGVDADVLSSWLDYLGIGPNATIRLDLFTERIKGATYDFVNGWGSPETPSLVANSSDKHVRIPGNMKPHGVAVHPSPSHAAAVGWRSPVAGAVRVEGTVARAHPECGNGVAWSLELRRGATRQRLAAGVAAGPRVVKVGPVGPLAVQPGDLVSLLIGPRDGNHACDLTDVALTLRPAAGGDGDGGRVWDLARDVSGDILAGNPHADRFGNADVWHFYKEAVRGSQGPVIPAGSLLARWLATPDADQKRTLAVEIQKLLTADTPPAKDHPDGALYRQLVSLGGPLFAGRGATPPAPADAAPPTAATEMPWGVDPSMFGRDPDGRAIDAASLRVHAPSVVEVRLPADLVAGCELVATAVLAAAPEGVGSVQVRCQAEKPGSLTELRDDAPVLVADAEGSAARARFERGFDDFRRWFPAALCYPRIVPVDEAVTLTLFHREDGPLRRLMLDEAQASRIDRLWDELHFVSRDALTQVDAFAQIMEYATQDGDPRLLEPFRKPINDRAAAFRKALIDAEPRHLDAVATLAARAYRRPLTVAEARELRGFYRKLRDEEIPHDEAIRLTLARVLVAPAFLYRIEEPGPGAGPSPVSDWELAVRLSYFLWSSMPDDPLREAAAAGRLRDPEVLASQARRMIRDENVRRLAIEFACQWLHVYDFDTLDEKSERHFPTFNALRGAMYEEAIRFFTDLFRRDASVLSILDADHTFVNDALARHYGIPGVEGPGWRRVDGVRGYARGGVLGLSATLAKESGASRTSPTLRGNWVFEVLLGERLPRPPKDVPRLPEDEAEGGGLTVRQLVEKHSRDVRCAGCHVKVDPFGLALEGFDAIGRRRDKDLGGRPIDARARLQDGSEFVGIDGLRQYLLTTRREAVLRQFCRKLLGYALGRGVQLSDEPLLGEMRRRLEADGYRFSAAVEAIVLSRQFREIRGRDAALAAAP